MRHAWAIDGWKRLAPRCDLAIAVGLALLSAALYAQTVFFDFVSFDDPTVLLAHPNLYNESSLWASLREIFVGYFPREEPLLFRDITWALDARLYGLDNPLGFHLGNVVLNALNTALLFGWLLATTRRRDFAALTALLFALLPVHAEPVAWVMGRKDLLCAFFVLGAALAQTLELREEHPPRRRGYYAATLACTVLALFSKSNAVALFGMLALHQLFLPFLDGSQGPRAAWPGRRALASCARRLAPHAAISVAFFVWYRAILVDYGVLGWNAPDGLHPDHLAVMVRFVPLLLAQYLLHIAWPFQLSAYYWWPHVEVPLSGGALAVAVAMTLATLGGLVWCLRCRRDLAFYPLAFLALLGPQLGFAYVGFWSADRYIYLASFAAVALLAHGALAWVRQGGGRRAFATVAVLAFAVLSTVQTLRQQQVWQNSETLWTYEAYLDAPSLFALQALAKHYVKRAEAEPWPEQRDHWAARAELEIERGIEIERALGRQSTRYRSAEQLHLARLYALRGRLSTLRGEALESQIPHYEKAYDLAPERGSALLLATRYYAAAESADPEERPAFARRALEMFRAAVAYTGPDALRIQRMQHLFATYFDERRFPFLADEIRETRRELAL